MPVSPVAQSPAGALPLWLRALSRLPWGLLYGLTAGVALLADRVLRYRREGLPFNLGWWAFTFPLGVYAVATLSLYRVTGFGLFAATGVLLATLLIGLWALVLSKTLGEMVRGHLFHAPCLAAVH